MCWGEITDVAKALIARERQRHQMQAAIAWKTAELTTFGIQQLFSKRPQPLPPPVQAFPNLFDARTETAPQVKSWELDKARMLQFTHRNNRQFINR